jgi:hypothetical protein
MARNAANPRPFQGFRLAFVSTDVHRLVARRLLVSDDQELW